VSAADWTEWMKRIEGKIDQLLAAKGTITGAVTISVVADDADLDGQWGDPEVRKDPKRWDGESQVGKRFSECPAEFLRTLASFFIWQAEKDEKSGDEQKIKYAGYKRRDAARALGWAKRIDAGYKPPANPLEPAVAEEGW
jgi:hypothetical protein